MTNGELLQHISSLHEAFCGLTDMHVKLNPHRTKVWEGWIQEGFTNADLRDVIRYVQAKIKEGLRREESFRFETMITPDRLKGFSRFEEDLHLSRKLFRKRSDKPINKVIQTPEGPVHYADHESTPEPKRFSLEMIAESIRKAGGKQ